ncbi:S8 family serine peptidase [Streptomyces sp. SID14515]|uniref:S8 family peptidase n=1 Tax=Streptomyces sp. SID14515 TaxID=2706074 RepID=UPI0031BADBBD
MPSQARRRRAAAIAVVAALATTGAAVPATAGPQTAQKAAESANAATPHRVQLITGDVVEVTSGHVTGFDPAPGRENIPVHLREDGDRSLVVPLDAQRLISTGTVDERLFEVTGLDTEAARASYRNGLKVIVGYTDAAAATTARAAVAAAGGTKVRRTIEALNAQAVTTPGRDLPQLWKALTRAGGGGDGTARRTAAGIDRVWLDGTVTAQLDVSVPQIGADKVWAAGYDGTGVKVAVLDTGVDETHPDLTGQQIAEKNFSASADAKDRQGHGTHVASTIAGTGAKAGGAYKGVAPGARLIDGKVLDDSGSGNESDIITAVEWAVGEGADIINMSLGGPDSPGVEPLEETVDHYSESAGVLFAIAAGNEGPGASTIGTPGAADRALTVGAVDDGDAMASFSSRGPRVGDGAIKPDVTAPGVDITAASAPGSAIATEYGENPEGYVTISGTSMATPHVAGAAALLKQRNPDWRAAELKGALTGSAKDTGFTAFEQGAGRIQADRAVEQTVHAEPVSLNFGSVEWPHDDDRPVVRTLTYRNSADADVTLDLTASGAGPGGEAAPEGMFTVSPGSVTVPAGGAAEVTVTADTAIDAPDGQYSAAVVATGGRQSVRSAAAVDRETPSYPVRLRHLGRDGRAAAAFQTYVTGLSGEAAGQEFALDETGDSTELRLPVGEYSVQGIVLADRADSTKGADWIAQPKLTVDGPQDVTLDARTAKPVDITVPDRRATARQAHAGYTLKVDGLDRKFGWRLPSFENFRSAGLGPDVTDGSLQQVWDAHFASGENTQYSQIYGGPVTRPATGYRKHARGEDFARLVAGLGEPVAGKDAFLTPLGLLPTAGFGLASGRTLPSPSTQTLYLAGATGTKWYVGFEQLGDTLPNGWQLTDSRYGFNGETFRAGRTYRTDFNTGVYGPVLSDAQGIRRSGDTLYAFLNMFSDGQGHDGSTTVESARTTLHRNGEKIAENDDDLSVGSFPVPAEDAEYTLGTSITRSPKIARVGTRIDAAWTFRSRSGDEGDLPVSVVRFRPEVDLRSQVRAGRPVSVPVEIQGAAAGGNLRSLKVEASYDNAVSWQKVPVVLGRALLRAPAEDRAIALRAVIVDRRGNTSTLTFHDAFVGR